MGRHILEALLNGDPTGLLAGGAAFLGGAWDALKEKFEEAGGWDAVQDMFEDFRDEWLPDASTYERAREALDELLENVNEFRENVAEDIGDAVNDILDTGDVEAQADGGLGETHDIFTPETDGVPNPPVGEIPGVGTGGGGMNRDVDSGYGGDSGGGGGSSPDSPTPLGDSSPPPAPDPYGNAPTAEDLGVPEGSYIETRPDGTVQITYPDGTTEVRTWP